MNKAAFITGIGHRLGLYLAEQLLAEGYTLYGHYHRERDSIAQLRAAGVTLWPCDFSLPHELQIFAQKIKTIPRLDLLIHNASIFAPSDTDVTQQFEDLAKLCAVHMQGPMLLMETLHQALLQGENSNVIALTDIYVHHPNSHYSGYCASKAGLDNLMQSYARRFAPGIRVNCIEPGPIAFLPEHSEVHRQEVLARTPLAKEGGFKPIWETVKYLNDNEYLTGARIAVDGGRSIAEL